MRFVGDTYVADSTQYIYTTHIPLYLLVQSVKIQTETNMIFPFFMLVKTIREYCQLKPHFSLSLIARHVVLVSTYRHIYQHNIIYLHLTSTREGRHSPFLIASLHYVI